MERDRSQEERLRLLDLPELVPVPKEEMETEPHGDKLQDVVERIIRGPRDGETKERRSA